MYIFGLAFHLKVKRKVLRQTQKMVWNRWLLLLQPINTAKPVLFTREKKYVLLENSSLSPKIAEICLSFEITRDTLHAFLKCHAGAARQVAVQVEYPVCILAKILTDPSSQTRTAFLDTHLSLASVDLLGRITNLSQINPGSIQRRGRDLTTPSIRWHFVTRAFQFPVQGIQLFFDPGNISHHFPYSTWQPSEILRARKWGGVRSHGAWKDWRMHRSCLSAYVRMNPPIYSMNIRVYTYS